jgi:hypothetical protein
MSDNEYSYTAIVVRCRQIEDPDPDLFVIYYKVYITKVDC